MARKPTKLPSGEKQKPERQVVKKAAKDGPKSPSPVQRKMDMRVLADQKNDPKPNKKDPSPAKPKPKGSGKKR